MHRDTSRPAQQATEPRKARSVLCLSVVVDSTRENVAIHGEFEQHSWPAVRSVVYTIMTVFIYTCTPYSLA